MKTLIFSLGILLCFSVSAQDINELSLDELLAIDVDKSSADIRFDPEVGLSGKTINLGMILPVSKFRDYSEELYYAARLAVTEINQAGGVLGKRLYLIPADDAADAGFAVEKAMILADSCEVRYVIGPTSSGRFTDVISKVALDRGVMVISPSATSDNITSLQDGGLGFRTSASDKLQGKVAADLAYSNLQKSTASVFYIDNDYGEGLGAEFSKNFERMGGKILARTSYSPLVDLDNYDVTEKLSEALKDRPEVLYMVSNDVDLQKISARMADMELFKDVKPIIIGSDGARGPNLANNKGKVLNGMYGTAVSTGDNQSFLEKFEKAYGWQPVNSEAGDAYDIVYLIALGLHQADSSDPREVSKLMVDLTSGGEKVNAEDWNKIKSLIRRGKDIDFQGTSGTLDFDENGDVKSRNFEIWRLGDSGIITEIDNYQMSGN